MDRPGPVDRAEDRRVLRAFVAEVTGAPAATVDRRCVTCGGDDHGQPVVGGTPEPTWASLARTPGVLALAVSTRGPVGVDVERVGRVAAAALDVFARSETDVIARDADPDLLRTVLWVGKEAVLKADGRGLRVDPRAVALRWVDDELVAAPSGSCSSPASAPAAPVAPARTSVRVDGDLVVVIAQARPGGNARRPATGR